ncbi:MAG TPA: hypothetical protein VN841_04230 [Bryobacteraceae bacterium]|nr:hypothetical protein [Bryobacteraceae bacterium]
MTRFSVARPAAIAVLAAAAAWAQSPTINDLPSREFGQPILVNPLVSNAPNLVEGRELYSPSEIAYDAFNVILYVADTSNNRVLAWKNPQGLGKGNPADLVIGQRDLASTFAQGPTSSQPNGFHNPASIAVDNVGSLYVLDASNNRILRFPAPFGQSGGFLQWDLVIGQTSINSGGSPNEGGSPSASVLNLQYGGGMAFDAQYNLWVADAGNNRVLRFNNAVLIPNAVEPKADIVLGQGNAKCVGSDPFACSGATTSAIDLTGFSRPANLRFDAQQPQNLYVSDALNRVLYFQGPFTAGDNFHAAARVLGVAPTPAAGQKPQPTPNSYTLSSPGGVLTDGINIYVCDSGNNRIVRYGPPASWAAATPTQPSPAALSVIGQTDLNSGKPNKGQVAPDGTTLNNPQTAIFPFGGTGDMWVVDGGNNRVVSFPQSGSSFGQATRVLGQIDFGYDAVNLIEGREVWLANNAAGGDIVVDRNSNPPHLYIADTFNNRILGFRDARTVGTDARSVLTQKADLVIGQPDVYTSVMNYPNGNLGTTPTPSATGLNAPTGLALDTSGNLYVADEGNGRVLRFPAPYNQAQSSLLQANLVLGQSGFTTPPVSGITGPANMAAPFGLAMLSDGSLAVSDRQLNRVLIFRRSNGDFSNYEAATIVIGQSNFNDSQPVPLATANYGLHSPAHIATDTSDRLYVADTSNNRVAIFTQVLSTAAGGTLGSTVTGLNTPLGVTVSAATGEMWIADTGSNQVKRFPEYVSFQFNPNPTAQLGSVNPLAVALDPFGNVIVAEASNRISFYYPKLTYQHAATYNQRPLAPGQLAYLYRLGADFSFTPADGTQTSPWPYTLGDIQVTVNGIPAPVFRVNVTRIDFQVPQSAPTSGTATFVVSQASTGAILAAANIQMALTNPGFFTSNAQGTGQVAAFNQDGSVNSPSNAIPRGQVISFCLTGAGPVPNGPPDGQPPSSSAPTPGSLVLLSGSFTGGVVPSNLVQYSGLGCGFAGGWQVNFQVPTQVPPGANNVVALIYEDVPSNAGPTSQPLVVVFAAK